MLTTIELLSCTDRLRTRGRLKAELLHCLYVEECTSEGARGEKNKHGDEGNHHGAA